ncbi:DUF1499 domain-containing protein [Aporhodopirellula aestuarii]|uniref:DUF1499 domain-containing protein n=1 Tax=Aporhodopirellula aestuarii TaxID=2950107 RepID=A0ABT0U9L8_9BACT|nr:DUF1499 domain-containing protein [Aporhodopirellula aestuarii]MCM2373046.1 DUF1499 domain-containing protein [Aporhodopirellula aestuarii]
MLGYVAIGVGAAMAGRLFWMIDDWGRDWTTNHARLSATQTDPMLQPIEIDADVKDVETVIQNWVDLQPAWAIVSETETGQGPLSQQPSIGASSSMRRLHLTRTTPVFRFVDDIQIELTPIESGPSGGPRTRVDAGSRSRVGKGDLGQNPRNLKELRQGILDQSHPTTK